MKAISAVLMAGVALVAVGCGKSWTPGHSASPAAASKHKPAQHEAVATQVDDAERTIELQAQRAKHDIDQITSEAEQALHDAKGHAVTTAKQHAQDLSEFSAELVEDAKDRAEDVPEAVDEEVSQQIKKRLHFPSKHPASEEETPNEN